MSAKKEVEHITRTRMVNRTDVAEYEAEGWTFVKNSGSQSAIMEKVEKVQAPVVPPVKKEEKDQKPQE